MGDSFQSEEDRAYEAVNGRKRDEASPRQPQYEDTALPEREYEDS